MPRFSVIIPAFNAENTLLRAVESVLNQVFSDYEVIIVNDGSTDGTATVIEKLVLDSRVKAVNQQNAGVSAARNLGASKAKGDCLLFLDSDDELTADSLSNFFEHIKLNPKADLFSAGNKRVSSVKSSITIPEKGRYFSRLSGSFLIRKDLFFKIGGYDEQFKFSENTELVHRLKLDGGKEVLMPFISLVYYENQSGESKNLQNMIDSLTLFLEKHSNTLTPHVKHLYHQIIGVNLMRFRDFSQSQKHLKKAVKYKPLKLSTWGRLILSHFPFVAKRLYSQTVNHA